MTSKTKKQHYVPRFYLKKFSIKNQKKQIGIYNTEKDLFIGKGDLKNQAKENYFYDKEGEFEEMLSKLENATSTIFNEIINHNKLPKENSEDHVTLLVFVLVQILRTKFQADMTNDMIDQFVKKIHKNDERFKEDIENIKIGITNPIALSMTALEKSVPATLDLKFKLLKNITELPFITSDNPVVRYNQLLENRRQPGGITGLESKGLQIFFPISPDLTLLLYDYRTYKVGDRRSKIIDIKSIKEIDQLNSLQLLNCDVNIYFNELINRDYIKKIQFEIKNFEKAGIVNVGEYGLLNGKKEEADSTIIVSGASDLKINLKMQCIKETSSTKYFKLNGSAFYPRN